VNILDRAKQHYDALGRNSILVPEWGDDNGPLKVTWTPMTALEHRKILGEEGGRSAKVLISTVILKAQDADGNRLFKEEDRAALQSMVDLRIITRIANAIFADKSIEDLEKN
jgi:hypothetical protein